MALTISSKADQSKTLPVLLAATLASHSVPEAISEVQYVDNDDVGGGTAIKHESSEGKVTSKETEILRLYLDLCSSILSKERFHEEISWLIKSTNLASGDFKTLEPHLLDLDKHLTLRTHLNGYSTTVAEVAIWGTLRGNRISYAYIKKNHMINVGRWFRHVEEINPWITSSLEALNARGKEKKAAQGKAGASYDISLPDTDKGVVTRFPPEPSGYLHIGHMKAALLNDYFAHDKYKGTLLVRFDDTNPSKEKEEFQDAIIEDLALIGVKPDKTSFTSDYFDELYNYCVRMIKEGNAYADDTDQETMREQRFNGIPSTRRDRPVEESLEVLGEMMKGSEEGLKACIRAKISADNPNKAMRDPVIYRCNPLPHHRTGSKWKAYPTYDFCCPIVDSMEGVTHALRTNEYRDRNPQYEWMLDALKLRKVHIWDFSRMNFIRTLLSKRKLTKFVDQGVVWGWDDPRFPTVRGIRRRGMTIPALREFILKQGPSRNIVNLDWTIFWATNKKYIDPIAPRYTAVLKDGAVKTNVIGAKHTPYTEEKPCHGKNAELGKKRVAYSKSILIDQEDAASFRVGEEITLMNWGNAFVRSKLSSPVKTMDLELHLDGDVKKTEKKVTWLSVEGQNLVSVELVDFDFLITKDKLEEDDNVEDFLNPKTEFRVKAFADENVAGLKADAIIQLERKGYYRVDKAHASGQPAVLFNIPTGKTK